METAITALRIDDSVRATWRIVLFPGGKKGISLLSRCGSAQTSL